MRKKISARELARWKVVDRIHPFGDIRADMRNGILCDLLRALEGQSLLGMRSYVIEAKKVEEVTEDNVADLLGLKWED